MSFSFFRAVVQDATQHAKLETTGQPQCRLGHRVETGTAAADGVFAEWSWDGSELRASVDRFGFYSLFYYSDERQVIVSSSPLQLIALGAPAEPDDAALGVFFRIGLFISDQTPFRHIRVLPADGKLVWRAGAAATVTSVGRPLVPVAVGMTIEQAVDGYSELFRQAIRRNLQSIQSIQGNSGSQKNEVVLPLSGGRDSRHILFEMKRQDALPTRCITYNYQPRGLDAEAASARRVAEAVGARHDLLDGTQSPFRDFVRTLLFTHLCSDEHSQMVPLRNVALSHQNAGAPITTLDGIAGDVLSRNKSFAQSERYQQCRAGKWTDVAEKMASDHAKYSGFVPEELFGDAFVQRRFARGDAIARIADELRQFESAAEPATAFLFANRTRREISLVSTAVLAHARVLCPYLDHELVNFTLSMPEEITRDGSFHDRVIRTMYPEYADLPYHDQLNVSWQRQSPWWRLKAAAAGVGAVGRVRPINALTEVVAQAQMFVSGRRRQQNVYRLYWMCLHAANDASGARRLLRALEDFDRSAAR